MEKMYLFIDETTDFPTEFSVFKNRSDAVKEIAARIGFYIMDCIADNNRDEAVNTVKDMLVYQDSYIDDSGRETEYYSEVVMKDENFTQSLSVEEAEVR